MCFESPCKRFVRHCLVLRCYWGDIFLSMYKPTYLVDVQYNSPTFSFLFSGLLWFVEGMLVLNTCYFSATLDFFNSSYDVWVAKRFKGIGLKISMTHPIKKLQTFYSDSVWQETNRTEKPCFSPFFSTVLWSRCEPPPESALIMVARAYSRNACRCTASKGSEKQKNGWEWGFVRRLHCQKAACLSVSCIWAQCLLGDLWPGWCMLGL